jgi:glycosyltransferase involved in cell wall biosynthesis
VADAVVFRDLVSDRELTALYASSTLMALSRIEGFGLPPVEALLAGGRVIAAREPIYEEVLGDAACYAAEASPDAIAEAMLIATQSTPPIAALRRLEARFSWRATADALLAAYRTAQDLR